MTTPVDAAVPNLPACVGGTDTFRQVDHTLLIPAMTIMTSAQVKLHEVRIHTRAVDDRPHEPRGCAVRPRDQAIAASARR